MSSKDATLTSHAESSFDPDLYVSLYYSGEYSCEEEKNSTTWSFDKLHDIFKEGGFILTLTSLTVLSSVVHVAFANTDSDLDPIRLTR